MTVGEAIEGDVALSVVVATHDAAGVIEACLAALAAQSGAPAFEVVVADSSTDATPAIVRERFPWVRLLQFESPLALPELRGRGIAATRGAIVALLDPFAVAAPDWAAEVVRVHRRQAHPVVGGAVDLYRPAEASWARWAVYFNEYGLFMSPVERGETWIVPGCNLSYKRAALFDGATPRYPVFWKTFVNWELERSGAPPWLEPGVRVELNKPIAFVDFLATRALHGRCFAGMRVARSGAAVRLARALTTPAVPILQLWRWTAGFWPKRRHRLRFLSTLPAQFALFAVWAWGEARGYLGGTGRSCEQLHY